MLDVKHIKYFKEIKSFGERFKNIRVYVSLAKDGLG